jgi:BlaI family penicillinase repressor
MNLSKSEARVLEVLWDEPPLTVGQVVERLQQPTGWHANTIKTLLMRLVEKNAANRYKDGGRYFYRAILTRETVLSEESDSLLNRFFDGRTAPLVAHLADRKKLSDRDIREIQKILEELRNRGT